MSGWIEWVVAVGALAAAVTAVVVAGGKLGSVGRWIGRQIAEQLDEHIDGRFREHRDGIVEDVEAKLSGPLAKMLSEVTKNGGSSMKDAIDRIESLLTSHIRLSTRDREALWLAHRELKTRLDRLDDDPAGG